MPFVAWRRTTEPGACSFCLLLASRGAVYRSESTAGASDKYHTHCHCGAELETEPANADEVVIAPEDANRVIEFTNRHGSRYRYDLSDFRNRGVTSPPATPIQPPVTAAESAGQWARNSWSEMTPDDVVDHLLPAAEDRLLVEIVERQRAAVAARVRHGWRNGEHVVVSEIDLSDSQISGLLADFDDVVGGLPSDVKGQRIDVIIPVKDRSMKGEAVGGYVMRGTRVIKLNPKVARGEEWGRSAVGTHFAPAFDPAQSRRWVLTHEAGHVVDGIREDTMSARGKVKPKETGWHRSTFRSVDGGWKYGRSKTVEGYAEAYAQYHVGGPGNAVADAYARRYGW